MVLSADVLCENQIFMATSSFYINTCILAILASGDIIDLVSDSNLKKRLRNLRIKISIFNRYENYFNKI